MLTYGLKLCASEGGNASRAWEWLRCGSKNLPFGNPAESKLLRFDSRRLCGPRSRVVCLSRLSFKGGARRARLPRSGGRPLLLKGASPLSPA
jgi:hypothetical protein